MINLKEEAEANSFALALLMPEDMFIREIKESKKYKLQTVDSLVSVLAKKFQVSESAVKTRLCNLGLLSQL